MAIARLTTTTVVDGVEVRRRVEERTKRIEILTPFSQLGASGYSAVAYREWVEYENDVPVKITALPPLHLEITPNLFPLLSGVAYRVDTIATKATAAKKWPVVNGEHQKP